jgi:hypothetical protein
MFLRSEIRSSIAALLIVATPHLALAQRRYNSLRGYGPAVHRFPRARPIRFRPGSSYAIPSHRFWPRM